MKKRILSVFIAILFVMNCFPLSVIAEFEEDIDVIEVFLEDDFADKITIRKINGTLESDFSEIILYGKSEEDEVYLEADVTEYPGSSLQTVIVTNFRLSGNDSFKYKIANAPNEIQVPIVVLPKELIVIPTITYIFYGQNPPDVIPCKIEDQNVNDVNVSVSLIHNGDEYEYDTPVCNNSDYVPKIANGCKFEIKRYETHAVAIIENEADVYHVNSLELKAPSGYLIGLDNQKLAEDDFNESVIVNLKETSENKPNTIVYYLRNNDRDSIYYGAVSEKLEFPYYCNRKPAIVKAEIMTEEDNGFFKFEDFGIVTKNDFELAITARGTDIDNPTNIHLNLGNGTEIEPYESEKYEDNGVYYYIAYFKIEIPAESFADFKLTSYAENEFGNGEKEKLKITDANGNFVNNYNKNRVILDKIIPAKPKIKITYNNQDRYVEATGTIKDSESGVDTIEYFWNLKEDNELVKYGINNNGECEYTKEPNGDINFSVKLNYSDAPEDKYPYELNLRITDNAGNYNEDLYKYSDSENGCDTEPPNINIKGFRKKGSTEFKDCVNFLEFGNYAKEDIELVVEAEDISETDYVSGVKSVSLSNGNSNIAELSSPNEANEYVFVISKNTKFDNMLITAVDKDGFDKTINVKDQITEMKKNTITVESEPPEVTFDTSESSAIEENEEEKIYLYNKEGGVLTVNVNDDKHNDGICSGIGSVEITDEYDGITNTLHSETFTENQENAYDFPIDVSTLSDGIHHIKVMVTDNAGNNCDPYPAVQVIGIDELPPDGTISAEKNNAKEINGDLWFDKDEIVTFHVDAKPDVSGIESIRLWINGIEKNFTRNDIQTDKNGYFVIVDTTGIDYNYETEHKYVVTGDITDVAGNSASLEPCTVYIDCEPPSINKFTVLKESSALDKILNVLSFGAYSNDSLIFKAYVSDVDFDSGIDHVKIKYNGLDEEREMKDEGDGVYSYKIPVGTKVFQSNIIVTAYDKYGKSSLSCPNIENADQGKGVSDNVFAMIETEKPKVTISKPKGDGIVRDDKQIWFNSNKNISITIYDKDSGIRNADIEVNGIDVTADKNGTIIPKISATEAAKKRDNEKHIYTFDTDYFTKIAGESLNGEYEVKVSVVDNAGNVNSKESFTYHIDNRSPNVDRFEFLPATSDNISETSEYIEYLEYGYYFKKNFIANIHISDSAPSSGLNKAEYRLVSYDNGELKEEKTGEVIISDGIVHIDIPAGFKGQIFVKAFDNVGNYSDEETPKAFVAEDIPPEINISGIGDSRYSDANGNKLFTDDIAVTVTITDTKSGIREIGYYQTSEIDGFERRVLEVDGTSVEVDSEIGDGWIVTNKDVNLVTEITKTFIFDKDNNDITLVFDAMDNSGNVNEIVQSETFTIDKTAPIINVDINGGVNNTIYYNAGNRAVITIDVIERNFDAGLIQASIENAYNGNIPNISFQDLSATEHRAVVTFSEGDYTFDIRGTDLGGHSAEVNLDYEKVRRFYVDETPPVVEENFSDFVSRDTENYLNTEKTAVIKITEHNFDPNLVGLKILKKDAGTEHNENDLTDVTYSMVSMADWSDDNDTHTISIKFDDDAVYRIEISPSDPSGNTSDYRSSEIFEIDTTLPVVSAKNGSFVDEKNAVEFLDIYPYDRKDESVPTVEFTDVNFDYIKYSLTVYTPEYTNGRELSEVKPVSVYFDSDKDKSGIYEKNLFTLPDFSKDGVYALELIAVDKAGNESILNSNTYMRMVDSDVLAYISNSNAAKKTGWYSFQYENGDPISKRPDNFSDIDIVVLAKNDSDIDIVLRDYNGDEKNTDLTAEIDNSMYGVNVYRYTLKSEYFKDNFQDDTDTELYLSVKNENGRIDLGKMHIDNIPPSCNLPDDLKTWHWYFGEDSRTITVTNISELLDETNCKVYDNGKEIDFIYSETDGSLSFTLNGGWHNVGITLEDVAGNTYSIQEVDNIHIGYFWLWIIIIASVVFIGIIILIIYFVRKKRYS
jgi:hypothetical protein